MTTARALEEVRMFFFLFFFRQDRRLRFAFGGRRKWSAMRWRRALLLPPGETLRGSHRSRSSPAEPVAWEVDPRGGHSNATAHYPAGLEAGN